MTEHPPRAPQQSRLSAPHSAPEAGLIAYGPGWTSNPLALGEEKPASSPWRAEPLRRLCNLPQQ